jgi:hypothetical protein
MSINPLPRPRHLSAEASAKAGGGAGFFIAITKKITTMTDFT